jgi:elongation factor Ts
MAISAEMVRALRDKTGAGIMDCKQALVESNGDEEKAIEWLRQKGLRAYDKKQSRATSEGVIASYIHAGGKIGVLVEINCETDFVARTDVFQTFAREIAMQIAATGPRYVSRDDVPDEVLDKERSILRAQAASEGKPPHIADKVVEGRLRKFYEAACLMEQPYMRDEDKTVETLLKEVVGKLGENVAIRRFARFVLGQTGA